MCLHIFQKMVRRKDTKNLRLTNKFAGLEKKYRRFASGSEISQDKTNQIQYAFLQGPNSIEFKNRPENHFKRTACKSNWKVCLHKLLAGLHWQPQNGVKNCLGRKMKWRLNWDPKTTEQNASYACTAHLGERTNPPANFVITFRLWRSWSDALMTIWQNDEGRRVGCSIK